MKKYLLGMIAVVLAIGAVAFTKASSSQATNSHFDNTTFFYIGTGTSSADFENPSNWTTTNPGTCHALNTACQVDYAVNGASVSDLVTYITNNGGNLSGSSLTIRSRKA